jgi:hypothetical protein
MSIPVLAAPHLDPGTCRIEMDVPEGLTLAEILTAALPAASPAERAQCRIALVTDHGSQIILPEFWGHVRPRRNVRVVIRVIADSSGLRSILTVVVAIAAVAAAAYFAPALAGTFGLSGATWGAVITAGVTVVGTLLINALIPPVKPDSRDAENRYSITGLRNRAEPNGAVPVLLGTCRFAPPFAALTFSEIVGDFQHVRSLFNGGEGRLSMTDIRIGETSISEFTNVDLEIRDGLATDLPVSLYSRQVAEEAVSVELVRPLPRDELGEIIEGGASIETPVVRTTGADASGASIIIGFPSGLIQFDSGGKSKPETVSVRIEHRLAQAEEWILVETLVITAKKLESFYRQHTWSFASRGRWQIRMTMMTDETTDTKRQRRCSWASLQTLRPEYPLNYDRPLALIASRIKATYQLSGALDNLSVLGSRICPDFNWETGTWVMRATSNPAALYRFVLQSQVNPKPVGDAGIDIEQLEDWHDFCRINSLTYNRVLEETGTTLRDVLTEIAATGRATPRHDGVKWGVTIDRPQELIVDHISPRNSWDFRSTRTYFDPPHAFRVRFKDATNDFKDAERVIRWPGYTGPITLTEALEMPGVTDPAVVWREARRRMYEAIYRPDIYQVTQSGPIRVATRGDKVMVSQDVLDSVQRGARIKSVLGPLIELDEFVEMQAGQDYAIRFRTFADAEDVIGTSTVRIVRNMPGQTKVLTVTSTGSGIDRMPEAGALIMFGRAGTEAFSLVLTRVEATEDQHSILHLVDEAPIIDELLAADVIPAWSGRVGEELDENLLQPSAPIFKSVTSIFNGPGADPAYTMTYLITPGSGTVSTASFRIEHRLAGAPTWTIATIPAANGGGAVSTYAKDEVVEIRALGRSATGVDGPYSTTITIAIGAGDAEIPAALDIASIDITTLLGGALIQVATGADTATDQLQVYRSTSAILDRETDAAGTPILVAPFQSYSSALGDTTRAQLVTDGGLDSPAAWTAGAGWAVAGGVGAHTPGTSDTISQALATTAGKFYRVSFTVSGRTAGTVTPQLTGGSDRLGTVIGANGVHADRIQAVTGNDTIGFLASADFDGAIDTVVVYAETAACLVQGAHFIWIEPQNTDGVPGPLSGPFEIAI